MMKNIREILHSQIYASYTKPFVQNTKNIKAMNVNVSYIILWLFRISIKQIEESNSGNKKRRNFHAHCSVVTSIQCLFPALFCVFSQCDDENFTGAILIGVCA
jgi:hypothetical protein